MPQPPLTPEEIEHLAQRRASAKLGWLLHAAIYLVVNLLVFGLSRYGFGTRPWSAAPLLGWGLGLALHGCSVLLLGRGSAWRDRMVQKELKRLQDKTAKQRRQP